MDRLRNLIRNEMQKLGDEVSELTSSSLSSAHFSEPSVSGLINTDLNDLNDMVTNCRLLNYFGVVDDDCLWDIEELSALYQKLQQVSGSRETNRLLIIELEHLHLIEDIEVNLIDIEEGEGLVSEEYYKAEHNRQDRQLINCYSREFERLRGRLHHN